MSKEPIYRIKVEVLREEEDECKFIEIIRGGLNCSGFVILLDNGDCGSVIMHNVNKIDIANAIASNSHLMDASLIAKAMRDGKKVHPGRKKPAG